VWAKLIVLTVAVAVPVEVTPSKAGGLETDVVEEAVTVSKALSAELAGRSPVVPTSPPPDEQAASQKGTTAIAKEPTIQLHERRFDIMACLRANLLGFLDPLCLSTLLLFIASVPPSLYVDGLPNRRADRQSIMSKRIRPVVSCRCRLGQSRSNRSRRTGM
jgi:hypothetical protein